MKRFEMFYKTILKANNVINGCEAYLESSKLKEILIRQLNNNDILLNEASFIANSYHIKLKEIQISEVLEKFSLDTSSEISDSSIAKTLIISITSIVCELVEEINEITDSIELEIYNKLKKSLELFMEELKNFI